MSRGKVTFAPRLAQVAGSADLGKPEDLSAPVVASWRILCLRIAAIGVVVTGFALVLQVGTESSRAAARKAQIEQVIATSGMDVDGVSAGSTQPGRTTGENQ